MTTKELILREVKSLAKKTGHEITADAVKAKGHKCYLAVENVAMYGGYCLALVKVNGGGHEHFSKHFQCTIRSKPAIFLERLRAFNDALEYNDYIKNW